MSIKLKTNRSFPLILFIAGVLLFFTADFVFENKNIKTNIHKKTQEFNKAFLKNYTKAKNELIFLQDHFEANEPGKRINLDLVERYDKIFEDYGFVFIVQKSKETVFWSNNYVPFHETIRDNQLEGLIETKNGLYYQVIIDGGTYDYQALMLLKRSYNYQNKFIRNTYQSEYDMMPEEMTPTTEETVYQVVDKSQDKILFYFAKDDNEAIYSKSNLLYYLSIIFSILSLILIFYSLYSLVFYSIPLRTFKNRVKAVLLFIFLVIMARTALFFIGLASPLAQSELFSPSLYATSDYLPSLGDLFFNVLLILWIAWVVNDKFDYVKQNPVVGLWKTVVISVIGALLIGGSAFGAYALIKGLVINSRLNLNVNFVLSLDSYSVIGFLIICCILFALYLFARAILNYTKATLKPAKKRQMIFMSAFIALYLCTLLVGIKYPALLAVFVLLLSLLILNEKTNNEKHQRFSNLLVYVFVFSAISTIALYDFNREKEHDERKTLALKLSSDQDPIAEYLFLENQKVLLTDDVLHEIIYNDPYYEAGVYNYLTDYYFYDYWLKYDMQVTICHPEDLIIIKPTNFEANCVFFFDDYIESFGKPTISDYLFYLDNNTGRDSYIARIPVFFNQEELINYPDIEPDYYIFLEFDSKYIPRDLGFPELLVDESVELTRELINYSFAFYKFGELTLRVGAYFFNTTSSAYGEFDDGFTFFETEDFHHLNYQKDEDTQIIISREKDGFFEIIAPFSYLFILFFLIVVFMWGISYIREGKFDMHLNFKHRVQISMVFIVILSGIIIGWASVWFLLNVYENKSLNTVSEKAYSVLIELEHNLGEEPLLDHHYSYYISDQLLKLSNVFFTDINIFDPQGKLLASSRSRVYDEGLISALMNPTALCTMKEKNKSFFIHTEQIGKLEYLSAYIPLKNIDNQLLAYVNLPYFARESELRYEVSTFLVTFLNIYLLLLVLAIIIAFFISGYATRPLQLIRENLSQIKLGSTNVKINWTKKDEIGSLVNEYNRMIEELEISAELLAKNERETAWREMAKQVAHEIKNPLTPMKLSVQYLYKAWKDNVDDWESRLEGFTKTMIEQIDTLSVIASEFSDFAKLPSNNNSKMDLITFIPEVLELYKDFEKVKIKFESESGKMIVYADPNQMLRVFNNLIKNAIQSYGKDEIAYITIKCNKENDKAVISLIDNGCGIPDNQKKNIFKPYFTTKTGGLGLGLAMVKNIVEGFKGEITFESSENKGSAFTIELPLLN